MIWGYVWMMFLKQLYQIMFLGSPELLQRSLHTDLNIILKNVKIREDQHFTILQYNKNLIAKLSEIEHTNFISDQISKHNTFLHSFLSLEPEIANQQSQIKQKYVCTFSADLGIVKLMSRVAARVLQTSQNSMDKAKFLDSSLQEKFTVFRDELLENLKQGNKLNIQVILNAILDYVNSKYFKEIERLKAIIKIIKNGNFPDLGGVYVAAQPEPRKIQQYVKKEQTKTIDVEKQKQKQIRMQKMRKEQQNKQVVQALKKKKAKVTKDLVSNMYSTLDLAKTQLIEDLSYSANPQQKKKRLYDQMMSRNKFNYEQIKQFQSKRQIFEEKIQKFKEMMQKESKKIQQALVVVINKPISTPAPRQFLKIQKKMVTQQNATPQREQANDEDQQTHEKKTILPERIQKTYHKRQIRHLKAKSPIFAKQISFSAMHSTQQGFEHIRFDLKNEQIFIKSNRSRLPQIPGKSSLQNRYEGKQRGASDPKQDTKINIIKNVDIGANSFNVTNTNFFQNRSYKKSPRERVTPVQPLFESSNGVGFDYTFYLRKKGGKGFEFKHNQIV